MKSNWYFKLSKSGILCFFVCIVFGSQLHAQQTRITDYVVFGGKVAPGQTAPAAPGYGVQIASSCNLQATIQGGGPGSVGSYNLVKSTGSLTVNGNIYSGGTIQLANSNVVKGNISAGLTPAGVPGTIVSIGTSATIGISGNSTVGNINANGKVTIGGGNVYGKVTLPSPQSTYPYSGPAPAGGVIYGTPTLPALPQMPEIKNFPAFGSTNITSTITIIPGAYGDVNLGNKTLTLSGPGTYIFKSIKTTGPNCSIVYNFNNTATGNFIIYVHGDIKLNKTAFSMINGGSATRIFTETHGTGSTNTNDNTAAFDMSNGSNGTGNPSGWLGSLWAPYAAIKLGSPNGPSSSVMGALWSGTQVNIQNGVTITYAPFPLCGPTTANAGPDQTGAATCGLTTVTLAGNAPAVGTGNWSIVSGTGGSFGNVSSPTSTFSGTAGSTYTLRWTISDNPCTPSTDDVIITFKQNPATANAGPDQIGTATCGLTSLTLAGNTATVGTGSWSIVSGTGGAFGNASSPTSTFSGTTGSTYILRWTISNSPCTASTDDVTIKFNQNPTTANAGADQTGTATCGLTTVTLAGNVPNIGTGNWSIISGTGGSFGNVSSPTSTFSGTAGSTYTLRWMISDNPCPPSTDDVAITFNENPANVSAGMDKPLDFQNPTTLTGSSSTPNVTFNWSATNGGVITSATNTATITVSSAGTYVLTVTSTNIAGCAVTDEVIVTGKVNDIIGSELQAVVQNGGAPSPFFEIQNGKIFIDVIVKVGEYNYVKGKLTAQAGPWFMTDLLGEDASNLIITGLFPVNRLTALNIDPDLAPRIVYARPYYRAFNNSILVPTGKITQGDTSVRADLVRKGYDLSGEGIKIGVLSNSFNTSLVTTNPLVNSDASQDVGNKDLPGPGNPNNAAPVTVLKESPFVRSDEGRAMLQIIHDIAPKAQLYFRTGVETANDFAQGIRDLKAAGCDIIAEDITYITEPFLKDGVVAAAVAEVTAGAAGAAYISSAGNFASKSFEFPFIEMPAPGFLPGKAHDFGTNDAYLNVTLVPGQQYTIVLQWLDDIYSQGETATNGTKNDLDIYLTPNTDGTALFGFNRNNLFGDPIEFLPFVYSGLASTHLLIINNTITSNPARFKVVIFQGDITFNEYITGASTIIGQSNSLNAITVGAARYDKVSPYAGPLVIESFSSIGGTVVNTSPIPRSKPDLVAPDGVTTTVNMGPDYNSPNDPDINYSNFFGTSAAVPHVAGVAALIIEGRRKFLNQTSTPPGEMKSLLQSTATDIGTAGFDFSSGAGFINADAAMRSFAAPDPTLIQLVVPPNTTPGPAPFTLTVTGLNLSPTSVVNLGSVPLSTSFVNSGQLTATVPAYIGDPAITVVTPPITNNQENPDGGISEALKFTDVPKRQIVVKADNKLKKYAQNFPAFTAAITVDGVPLSLLPKAPGQTDQQVLQIFGLDVLTYTLPAGINAGSNIGTYTITPGRTFNPQNPADVRLQEIYQYTFNTGDLTIEKLPVTVIAGSLTATYKEKLPDIGFTYALTNTSDAANIPDPGALLGSIQTTHQSQIAKDGDGKDILGLVNGQAVTIVNGQAVTIVNGQAVTIVNGQAVTIVNNQTVPIVNGQALTIVNGIVTDTTPAVLIQPEINNLSFQVGPQSLLSTRTITNQVLVNGTYVSSTSKVVDITQESILDFNVNAAQTTMLNSLSNVNARGLVDQQSYTNGQAITIVNGQAVTIVNGQAVTIVNNQAVTIVNGQAVTIVNNQAIPIVNSQNRTAVVLDENEIGQGVNQLKSLNMITGLNVGAQYIIPGSLVNNNFEITHIAGVVTINPAPVTITPATGQNKVYGTDDPVFIYTNNAGLISSDFTGALGRASGTHVSTYAYTLGNLSAGANYSLSLSAVQPLATFAITPKPVLITPNPGQSKVYGSADPVFTFSNNAGLANNNFTGALGRLSGSNVGNYSYTIGNLSAGSNYNLSLNGTNKFAITKAPLQVKADLKWIHKGDPLPTFTSTITGLKNGDNPTVSHTLSPSCTGAAGVYTIIPLLNPFANSANYTVTYTNNKLYINPKGPGADDVDTYLECIEDRGASYLPQNRRYVAHFYSKNTNGTAVYVPIGVDNKLSSTGSFDGSEQPVVFLPGNGTTKFNVPFDGTALKWELRTYECYIKVTESVTARSTSVRCSNNANRVMMPENMINETGEPALPDTIYLPAPASKTAEMNKQVAGINVNRVTAYPNPATDKVIIIIPAGVLSDKEILLYDVNGKSHPAKVSGKISANSVELNVSGLQNGFYLIRLKTADGYKTVQIIKQ